MTKNIQTPGQEQEKVTEKKHFCAEHQGGCGQEVEKSEYSFSEMLCHFCAGKVQRGFGFSRGGANLARMKMNIPYYVRKVPRLERFSYRSQCRILAAASGDNGVLNLSQEESAIIPDVQKFIEKIYKPSEREEPMQKIMSHTEVW